VLKAKFIQTYLAMQSLMKSKLIRTLGVCFFLLAPFIFTTSCRVFRHDSKSVAEKKQKKVEKEAMAEFKKAEKQHIKNQSKSTRQMMKGTKKKAGIYNGPKRKRGFRKTKCN